MQRSFNHRRLWISFATLVAGGLVVTGCGTQAPAKATPPKVPTSVYTTTHTNKTKTVSNKVKKPSTGSSSTAAKKPAKTVTTVVSAAGLPLVATAASASPASGTWVGATSSVSSVLLPKGWTLHSSSANGSTYLRLNDPADPNAYVVEAITPFTRDLKGFYATFPAGAASYAIAGKAILFQLKNPSNPYPDRGLLANIADGQSLRVDVYLPAADAAVALRILDSFAGISGA
jgi:hypothetical protein